MVITERQEVSTQNDSGMKEAQFEEASLKKFGRQSVWQAIESYIDWALDAKDIITTTLPDYLARPDCCRTNVILEDFK